MAETYYDVLGVPRDATQEEIAAAYRERALETHPDRNDDPNAAEQFKLVTDARAVLSNEAERARYDRLGHHEYVRLTDGTTPNATTDADVQRGAASVDRRETERADEAATGSESGFEFGTERADSGATGRSGTTSTADSRSGTRSSSADRRSGGSSGTTASAGERTAGSSGTDRATDWFTGDGTDDAGGDGPSGQWGTTTNGTTTSGTTTSGTTDPSSGGAAAGAHASDGGDDSGGSGGFSVHDWTDEVEVDPAERAIDHHTAVFVVGLTLLYPWFVYASVTAAFPLYVNTTVAACTILLIGYLLTMPRIALASFGLWSVVVPVGVVSTAVVDPLSITGGLVLAGVWLPFGYACAIEWAMRP